jgi:hypothetical protein
MRFIPSAAAIALLAAAMGAAHAEAPKTREQVRAEYFEAVRNGDIQAGESSLTLRELYPHRYPAQQVAPAKTREQVRAEFEEARRTGGLLVGESGLTERELHPQQFPAAAVYQGKTREQVRAELAEAIRTGDIIGNGESSLTLREQYPHRYASKAATGNDGKSQPPVVSAPQATNAQVR